MWEGEKKYFCLPLVHTIVTDSCARSLTINYYVGKPQ